ncbi:hypothetical protein Hdeb2414_s0012g00394471 [Helianthus debilis subsp. tardiflorus]
MGETPSPWLAERVRAGRSRAAPGGGATTVAGFFKSHTVEIERIAGGETLATVTRWCR